MRFVFNKFPIKRSPYATNQICYPTKQNSFATNFSQEITIAQNLIRFLQISHKKSSHPRTKLIILNIQKEIHFLMNQPRVSRKAKHRNENWLSGYMYQWPVDRLLLSTRFACRRLEMRHFYGRALITTLCIIN